MKLAGNSGSAAVRRAALIIECSGDSEQAGSVTLASPVRWKAWQRQPPKSIDCLSQLRHGSLIQSLPRKVSNAAEFCQISTNEDSNTLSNIRPRIVCARWQGMARPSGL